MAMNTTPPITPPAMAPAWDDDLLEDIVAEGDGEAELEDDVDDDEVDVDVNAGVDVPKMVPVGIVVPVDSGALESRSAAAGLNPSPTLTSRYAQPGTAVPEGMFSGKTSGYTFVQFALQLLQVS